MATADGFVCDSWETDMASSMAPLPQEEAEPDPRELLREAIDVAGSAGAAARRLGVSTSYMLDVRHGRRPASPRILAALGLERRIVRIGGRP